MELRGGTSTSRREAMYLCTYATHGEACRIACTLVSAMLEACTAHSDVRFVARPDVHSVGMIKLALGIVLWPFGNCSLVHCGRLVI